MPSRIAELIRGELRRRGADAVTMADLAATLGVDECLLRSAIGRARDLGISGPGRRPMVWRVPPRPLAAGFAPVYADGRLTLRLRASDPARRPLVISAQHLDPSPPRELDLNTYPEPTTATGFGALGQALARLDDMAARWLTEGHELFALINRAWKATSTPIWSHDRLRVYCPDLGERIATQFWRDNAPATRLELVVWIDRKGDLLLVNTYPCAVEHTDPRSESTPQ